MAELDFDIALLRGADMYDFQGSIPLEGVTAVMGPSGSGKTTLLMALAGLEPQARGQVRFGETVWARGRRGLKPEARRIGFVFQEGRLFSHLSVAENLSYGARRRGVAPGAVQGVAEGLGLADLMGRRPHTLSGGEARRVAVARALASAPDILFMDEPLSGLDDDAKAQVLPYVARAVSGSGIPVVYVTHSRAEVTQFADRVLMISGGSIAGWGRTPASLAVTVVDAVPGRVTVEIDGGRLTLPGYGRPGDARRVAFAPEGLLISRDPPGPSGAATVLRGEVIAVRERPSGPDLTLRVAGQRLLWRIEHGTSLADVVPKAGERLWISVLAATLR